jgi:catechol 2,3-dioxygenase-like lactoylglutathione lyase family enzyme
MATNKLYRGRLIDHVQLVVRDIAKSKRFYAAVFETLSIPFGMQGDDYFQVDELFVSQKDSKHSAGALTARTHLAFSAKDEATVRRFYEVGLSAGGADNGKPGPRHYHPGYYAAFLIDPDANNIEAVYHGPAKWSAESIEITF